MSSVDVAKRGEVEDLEPALRWFGHVEMARKERGGLYGRKGRWVRTDGVSKAGYPE